MDESQIQVPMDKLSAEALDSVIEEFVTREGTEYGESDVELDTKKQQVMTQLRKGEVVILFDARSETVNLVLKRELDPRNHGQ